MTYLEERVKIADFNRLWEEAITLPDRLHPGDWSGMGKLHDGAGEALRPHDLCGHLSGGTLLYRSDSAGAGDPSRDRGVQQVGDIFFRGALRCGFWI